MREWDLEAVHKGTAFTIYGHIRLINAGKKMYVFEPDMYTGALL
jgi:hypothetical protein